MKEKSAPYLKEGPTPYSDLLRMVQHMIALAKEEAYEKGYNAGFEDGQKQNRL
jgi:flagellar biosynthesis/type III secretory pathway protein FliH